MKERRYVTAHTPDECDRITARRRPECQVCGAEIDNRTCVAWHLKRRSPYASGSSESSIITLKLCERCAESAESLMNEAVEDGRVPLW